MENPLKQTPRTQKGIGLTILNGIFFSQVLRPYVITHKIEELIHAVYPCFARPCPSTPKHGYIDSRVVKDRAEATKLLKEVLADDPGGEIILCPFISADYNMIWTPSSLVIGKGHDGATAGKNAVTVPLSGVIPSDLSKENLKAAKVAEDGDPYIEIVYRVKPDQDDYPSPSFALTQLRAGPRIASGGDYIPKMVEVEKVIVADPEKFKDRDWEKLIDAEADNPGVVVYHPGGARTDHFSIHAFTHGIPVIFSKEPKIGDVLEPIEGQQASYDPEAMLKGLMIGEKMKLDPSGAVKGQPISIALSAMLVALHNATVMTGEASKWVGMGAALMLRAGTAALRGEARHFTYRGKTNKPARSTIYTASFKHTLSRHRAQTEPLINIFRYGQWNGGGFGGMKWAACGAATAQLFEAVHTLAKNRDEKSAAGLVRALNLAVNQAHNGGWWLNKFMSETTFQTIQKGSIIDTAYTAPVFFIGDRIWKSIKQETFEAWVKKIARWPETTCRPPRVTGVKLIYQPGIDSVGLTFNSKLLTAGGTRQITAQVKDMASVKEYIQDHAYLVESDDGFAIEVRPPGKAPIVIWEEEKLNQAAEKFAAAKGGTL